MIACSTSPAITTTILQKGRSLARFSPTSTPSSPFYIHSSSSSNWLLLARLAWLPAAFRHSLLVVCPCCPIAKAGPAACLILLQSGCSFIVCLCCLTGRVWPGWPGCLLILLCCGYCVLCVRTYLTDVTCICAVLWRILMVSKCLLHVHLVRWSVCLDKYIT